MKEQKEYPIIWLVIVLVLMSLPFSATVQAQGVDYSHGPYEVGEFKINKNSLTRAMEDQLRSLVPMFKNECRMGKSIHTKSHSDSLRFKGVSLEESNLRNAQLAWERADEPIRFLNEYGVPQECFTDIQWIAGDSKDRVVTFSVVSSRDSRLASIIQNEEDIGSIRNEIKSINDRLADIEEKNANQDERLDSIKSTNDRQDMAIGNHEDRLRHLENKSWDVSGHIGLNAEHFADQLAPTISAGVTIGRLDLTGWYGFMPNTGTVDLDIGTVNTRRETYGGMATWYVLDTDRLSVGPSIGWEHGEDAIEGRGSYVKVYESALLGASANIKLIGPLHLKASFAYAPVIKSYSYDNQVLQDVNGNLRLNAGISVTF
jgi:uncharacterized coiled-coil protein SlyX